ncbi:MAG: hypothetical protein HOO87_12820 [Methyloglobulus sp.]|nr:hypothetical protein [Methyloglobulus sp.]
MIVIDKFHVVTMANEAIEKEFKDLTSHKPTKRSSCLKKTDS